MNDRVPIFVRAHTEILKREKRNERRGKYDPANEAPTPKGSRPKWPKYALVIDAETTIDERQALTFGFYRFCRLDANDGYVCIEEGIFYPDDLPKGNPNALSVLQQYVDAHPAETPPGYPAQLQLRSRAEFIEQVFWRVVLNPPDGTGGLIVGFNLAFDLARIAVECRTARRRNQGWSFIMSQDNDPQTGMLRHNPLRSRIIIKPKDSKAAFIRLAGVGARGKKTGKRLKAYTRGRFLDLRTLGWALRNESYSLKTASKAFTDIDKLDHEPTGRVTLDEIEYCRQDVRCTVAVLHGMKTDFDCHPIDLQPDQAYSPASIAKAYLRQMGLTPPLQKFALPREVLGAAMQAYYGGRAECRNRHSLVPVVYTDFLSEYPTVNTLMGLWRSLTAESVRIEDATEEVINLLASVTTGVVLNSEFWKRLPFFALVQPAGDILPVRTTYNGETNNIGINPLTSENPVWYAGPDLVAAALLSPSRRPPEVIRAFRVVPEGQQAGLKPVALRGMVEVDPKTDDFFKKVIESRARIKADQSIPKSERKALSYFLKILANAGSYGLFVEVNPERVGKGTREKVQVFSGENQFETTSPIVEPPGPWYCPVFAALITAAGRLLLALLERTVGDAGGTYLLCDTDSMAIVASELGGLAACIGGSHRLPDGRDAVKVLSWEDVRGNIVKKFEQLNPYDRAAVSGSILKIEDVNYFNGSQRELLGYAIAAKRYALFTRTQDSIHVENPKAHGLGFLYPPKDGFDEDAGTPVWVVEAWDWILQGALGLPQTDPDWFSLPAMMRFKITTPEVLKVLQARQIGLPYRDRVKPFNFVLSPLIDDLDGYPIHCESDRFTLIVPFTPDASRWYSLSYLNVHDGKRYRLGRPGRRLPSQAQPQTLADVVSRYRWHPEAKSLAPDGAACKRDTKGLLIRTPVITTGEPRYIGKETDRRWEQGEDISMLNPEVVEYRPNETARLVADPDLARDVRLVGRRTLAIAAGVSDKTVKAARRGDRLRKSTVGKLKKALNEL